MPRGGARVGAGRPRKADLAARAPKPLAAPSAPPAADLPRIPAGDASRAQTPLEYMLEVMNDPGADPRSRAQMAVAAAPYVHPKMGESGKKDAKADAAKKAAAGGGRFAAAAAPLKLVAKR